MLRRAHLDATQSSSSPWVSKDRFLAGPNGRLHPRPTGYSDTTHRKVRNSVLLGPLNSEQLYAYRRSDMSRRPEKDIVFATEEAIGPPADIIGVLGLVEARGVWGHGETLWVADANDGMLYAFSLDANADGTPGPDFGARYPEKDIALDPANGSPYGMAGLGVIAWVADSGRDDLFAYNLETGARVPGRDIDLHRHHIAPTGVWSNGHTFWVADSSSDKLYAYNHADGARDPGNDVNLTALSGGNNNNPWGLWAGGGELLVVQAKAGQVFVYNFHPRPPAAPATPGLSLSAGHSATGLWGDGPTLWATDESGATLRAYTWSTGLRDPDRDIALAPDNAQPNGIWGNDETLWVADFHADKFFAYDRSTGARDPDKDIEPLFDSAQDQTHGLTSDKFTPSGLWGSGGTVWVWGGALLTALLAYDVDTGAVNAGKDIPRFVENSHGMGMWGDGTVLWVADQWDGKLYAYDISARRHAPVHDFDLSAANDNPWGIWSDGRVLWASQAGGPNVHTYDFTPRAVRARAASVERTEATLEVSVFRGYLAEGPLYLAYRTLLPVEEEEFRVVEVELPADGSEVEFTLTGLTPRASYQVLASLDRDFPTDRTERALFTTARDSLPSFWEGTMTVGGSAIVLEYSKGDEDNDPEGSLPPPPPDATFTVGGVEYTVGSIDLNINIGRMDIAIEPNVPPDTDFVLELDGDPFSTSNASLSPNPPKDTDGRREDSGRGWVRELQGRWPGVLG